MSERHFFGYGSLVNLATHEFPGARPARAKGYRRAWLASTLRPVAYLSVEPADAEAELLGMVAEVPGRDWRALDARERAYRRRPSVVEAERPVKAMIYALAAEHRAPDRKHPVLLSYLDTVIQGYFRAFGAEGVAHFVATTDNWDVPFLDDRAAPRYARAQRLTEEERALADDVLGEVGARMITSPA